MINPTAGYYSVRFTDYFTRTDGVTADTDGRIMIDNAVVTIYAHFGQVSVNGSKVLGTLSKYHPSANMVSVMCSIGAGSEMGELVRAEIGTDGKITVYGTPSYSSTVRLTVTYATANVV